MNDKLNESSKSCKTKILLSLIFLTAIVTILTTGCTNIDKNIENYDIVILSDHKHWNPAMSSIPGLDMLPYLTNSSLEANKDITFHWVAEGNYSDKADFIRIIPDSAAEKGVKFQSLGNDTWSKSGEVIWFAYRDINVKDTPDRLNIHLTAVLDNETVCERDLGILRKVLVFYVEDNYYGINTNVKKVEVQKSDLKNE